MSLAELREDGHIGSSSPPTKKRKVVGLECGLDSAQQQASIVSQSNESNGNGTMAHNGNGVTSNGTENGSQKPIDEGLYSRQLFVLGKYAISHYDLEISAHTTIRPFFVLVLVHSIHISLPL